jgi:hypothetical protein
MKFMLLLRGDPAVFASLSAAQQGEVVAAHSAWAGALGAAGKLDGGAGFPSSSVRVLPAPGGARVETHSLLGDPLAPVGFYLIDVADLAEATRLAQQCPAIGFGETVDVLHLAH